ncbi:MAG: hypothetical protein WA885_15580 [Phormidesmis sp.]
MARRKKTSQVLPKAVKRLASIKSIDEKLDLGNGVTAAAFAKDIETLRQKLDDYNTLLSKVDAASNEIEQAERKVLLTSKNVLKGVAVKYGEDSNEYEMAGGTRPTERRRRRVSQPAAAAALV